MDFRTLQYFTVVAEELNFTRAAEKLKMSQPPLSNQIKQLEQDLGVQLFIRGKRHLKLTEAGNLLLKRSRQILELSDKTRQDLTSLGQELSGRIALGMVEGHAPFYAARWIAGFRREYPLIEYNLWNGSSDEVLDQLSRGIIDIAVIARPYDHEHLDGIFIGREPWCAFMSDENPLAKEYGDTIPLRELVGQPLIVPSRKSRREAILRWFQGIGEEPFVLSRLSNYLDAIALAEADAGIALFPQTTRHEPHPHVVSKVVVEPAKIAEYVLVWNKETPPRGAAKAFVDYVRDTLEEDIKAGRTEDFDAPEGADLL